MQRNGAKRARTAVTTTVRRTTRPPGPTAAQRARRPTKGARVKGPIRKAIGPELKFIDIAGAGYIADTTGTVTCLNLIGEGDDYTNRDARQATIKSVQLHGWFGPSDTTTTISKGRLLLVWDNAANGAIAAITDILVAANAYSFPNINNQNRFTILRDMPFTIGGIDTTATSTYAMSPSVFDVEVYLKINHITQFNGTAAAITSIQNGALLMVTIGTNGSATAGTFNIGTRVRFVDQ